MSSAGIIVWGLLDSLGQSSDGRIICISDTLTMEEHIQAEGWCCKLCAGRAVPTRDPCRDPQPSPGVAVGVVPALQPFAFCHFAAGVSAGNLLSIATAAP